MREHAAETDALDAAAQVIAFLRAGEFDRCRACMERVPAEIAPCTCVTQGGE